MFGSSQITSWDAWGMHHGDHNSEAYLRGVRQLKEWHERCRQREMIGKPGYCKDCGKKLPKGNECGWCSVCKLQHQAEIARNRRAKISKTKKARSNKCTSSMSIQIGATI